MAQRPATPKLTRALRLALAPLSRRLAAFGSPAPSERAALALRGTPRPAAQDRPAAEAAAMGSALGPAPLPSSAPVTATARAHRAAPAPAERVIFLVPLVGPDQVGDWQAVTERLRATLQGFLDQTRPDWQAVICCQRRPELPEDPRITHLPFDDPTRGNDKWRKLEALARHLPALGHEPAYVMSFDADDLLHRDAVEEMLTRQVRGGYLVERGYVRDAGTGATALAGPRSLDQPLRKPFWKLCGSCAALRHDPARDPAQADFLAEMLQHEHRMFPYLARLAGQRLVPLGRPSVLYVLNHGENFGARRGRVSFKTRFVERFRVTDAETLAAIDRDFPAP